MHFSKKLLLLLFILSFIDCSHRISEDKFILVYSDLVIAQDTLAGKLSLSQIKAKVFTKYGVSDKEYSATLNYYNSEPKKWEAFFNRAIAHVESLQGKKGK